jgi:hypothetical protein
VMRENSKLKENSNETWKKERNQDWKWYQRWQ